MIVQIMSPTPFLDLALPLIVIWLSAAVATRSLLDTLHSTSLFKHIMNAVRRVAGNRLGVEWPVEDDESITSEQWRVWWNICSKPLPLWLADIMTCSRCQSHHLGYLFGVLLLPFYSHLLSWLQLSAWLTFMFFSVPYGAYWLTWKAPISNS